MNDREKVRLTTLSHGSGWACKIGPEDLAQVLGNLKISTNDSVIADYSNTDDAAVVRLKGGKLILQTVDFFTPFWQKKIYDYCARTEGVILFKYVLNTVRDFIPNEWYMI